MICICSKFPSENNNLLVKSRVQNNFNEFNQMFQNTVKPALKTTSE